MRLDNTPLPMGAPASASSIGSAHNGAIIFNGGAEVSPPKSGKRPPLATADRLPSATVQVWYPRSGPKLKDYNPGHVSLQVYGTTQQPYSSKINTGQGMIGKSGYVSFADDVRNAGNRMPDRNYLLHGLDTGAMNAYLNSGDKKLDRYSLLTNNCADHVMNVLQAGGAMEQASAAGKAAAILAPIKKPKTVAQLCDNLRDQGVAEKLKPNANTPGKGQMPLSRLAGLR